MSADSKLEAIKKKLRKLIKLQDGAKQINSEGEANAAAAAIQRLLTEYNLQLCDVHEEKDASGNILEETMSTYTYKSIGGQWERILMHVICKWNFCMCFSQGKSSSNRMLVVGKEENMITVKWLHKMLCEKFVELGKKHFKELGVTHIGLDTYLRRYLMGCADGLNSKFRLEAEREKEEALKKKNQQEREAATTMLAKIDSLVIRNNAEIQEYLSSKYKISAGKSRNVKYDNSYMQGQNDGKNTSIHKAVNESRNSQASKVKMLN